jgi:hypothetical protein
VQGKVASGSGVELDGLEPKQLGERRIVAADFLEKRSASSRRTNVSAALSVSALTTAQTSMRREAGADEKGGSAATPTLM